MMIKIKKNMAQCLNCWDTIVSKYPHDFVTCTCGNISVDGGLSYIKRSAKNPKKLRELTIYEKEAKKMAKPTKPDRSGSFWSTCIHEASHAVLAINMGCKVTRIWTNPKTCAGKCYFSYPKDNVIMASVLLAGSVGEQLWTGRSKNFMTKEDYEDCKKSKITMGSLSFLMPRVKQILRNYKKKVIKLARALKKEKSLSFKEIKAIFNLSNNYWKE